MNVISTTTVNTNNAWGFGGWSGERVEYDNDLILERGKYFYRHAPASKKRTWRVKVGRGFEIEIDGTKKAFVGIYKYSENFVALFSNAPDSYYFKYGMHYRLEKIIEV